MSDEERNSKTTELSSEGAEPARLHLSTLQPLPTKCSKRGCQNTFSQNRNKSLRFCEDCKAEKNKNRQQSYRDRKKEKEWAIEAVSFQSGNAISEEHAKQILVNEWGLSRPHFISTVYEAGKRAAERSKVADSYFFWANGPAQTLASVKTKQASPLAKVEGDNILAGEVSYKKEIFALYHFVEAWREDGIQTFDEYLAERRSCKVGGTVNRGNKYFGKDFHNTPEGPHGRWEEMFVKWDPDGLRPEYTQEDAKKWLASLSDFKKRLLIACRNSYKSNFTLVYLVGAVLCCPDVRLLLVSETKPLSRAFIQGFRDFFTIKNPNEPSRFVRLFPEYCIEIGDGDSLTFESPMAHLGLFQPTANSTSMESGGWAGSRADLILFEDPISNTTVGTDDQRDKSVAKYDAILELLEVGGYVQANGTPWHENDLYATILERNAKSDDKQLLYTIDPAWTVKESGRGKDIYDLEEQDVDLLFPARLTWKVLQQKLRDGDAKARTFRMQSLCEFLSEVDESLKLHFDIDVLKNNAILSSVVPPGGDIYAASDLGFAKTRYADPSCFTIFKIVDSKMFVLHQETANLRTSEKAETIVRLARQYSGRLKTWLIEKYPTWEDLNTEIQREAARYGVVLPLYWAEPTRNLDAKFHRLKSIEIALSRNNVKFVGDPATGWINDLFLELTRLDGTGTKRRSSSIHDDRGDSLALGIKYFLPNPDDEDVVVRKKLEDEQMAAQALRDSYDMIFGGQSKWHVGGPNATPPPEEPAPRSFGWPTSKTSVFKSFPRK